MKIKFYLLFAFLFVITNCLQSTFTFAQTIATGGDNSIAICNDKTLMTWGSNFAGGLGNGTTVDTSLVPVHVSFLAGIAAIAAGRSHFLAVKNDSTVWAWGYNVEGELGNGSNVFGSNVPLHVSSLTGIISVAGGDHHSLALKNDGTVWAWGLNIKGQLGNATNTSSYIPVQVNFLTGIIAIASGSDYSLALKNDSTVWAWGRNNNGELGNATNSSFENVPVEVISLTGIIAIAAGANYSLAVKKDGTVWAWGSNLYGELGNGSYTDSNVPMQVSLLTGIMAIAGGGWHGVALKNDGTVWTWGVNTIGELGNGSNTNSNVPAQINSLSGITAITSKAYHSLCFKNNGTVWAWGYNSYGQLGNGTDSCSNVPVKVIGLCSPLTNEVTEITEPLNISIFPNPSFGIFNLQKNKFENMQIKIYNDYGKCIYQQIIQSANQQIDLSMQPNGIYFLNIETKNETVSKKIIINK